MKSVTERLDRYLRRRPVLGEGVYIASGAVVLGDVRLGDRSSVWFNATLRGDIHRIEIGADTNIQDNAVVHVADDYPAIIGDWVTVGHSAILHACEIGDRSLIGMGATILDGAVVGRECLIGANALVTPGTRIPDGSMVLGAPGKITRALSEKERAGLKPWAEKYVDNAAYCLARRLNVGRPLPS